MPEAKAVLVRYCQYFPIRRERESVDWPQVNTLTLPCWLVLLSKSPAAFVAELSGQIASSHMRVHPAEREVCLVRFHTCISRTRRVQSLGYHPRGDSTTRRGVGLRGATAQPERNGGRRLAGGSSSRLGFLGIRPPQSRPGGV